MDINIDRIRSEMKNREQWLCWEAALRDGKETKLPKDPETGDFAQTDDPSTWGSFLNANGKVKAGQMDGIGFVFTEDDNYVGIDLDNCRDPETGEWEDWALDVMQDIGGWIEISPSGTGTHIILKGELPGDRNRKGDIEMYEDGRFFTVTGQLVDENGERLDDDKDTPEIKEAQQALDAVYDRFLAEEDESANETDVDVDPDKWGHLDLEDHDGGSRTSHSGGPNIDDLPPELREIVETAKAANNGYRFTQLWRGNWEEYYPSHSEGDMGFCDMLAFWFSGDPERMDRVFRASGLMRPKWDDVRYSDGSTYGERTIEKAIAEVNDHYDDEYYTDLVNEQEDGYDNETNDNDENETDSEETPSDENENDDGAGFSSEDANESESSSSSEPSDTESGNTTTGNSDSGKNTSNDTSESDDSAQDSNQRQSQGRSGGRGRGSGRKRSQKRRDGIPDDIASSSNSGAKGSSSSPGPSGGDSGDVDEDDEEEFYTELNFDTEPDDGDESEDGIVDDDIFDDEPADGDEDEEELPSEEEAASIFDGMGEEESSTPGGEAEIPDTTYDDFATDSEDESSETSPDVDESEDTAPYDSTSSEETNEQQSSREKRTSDRTGDRPGDSEEGLGRFEKKTKTRLEDIEAELSRLDEELERAKAELRHDVELEDDKLERVYWELQQYENIVDKREKQLETMYQLVVLLCHVQPEPLFDRVENILLSEEGIPPKNIFNESVEEIIDHYHEETAAMDSSADPEPVDETMGGRGRSKRTSPSEPSGASERPNSEQVRTNGDGDLPHDKGGEEDEETSFLSQFF